MKRRCSKRRTKYKKHLRAGPGCAAVKGSILPHSSRVITRRRWNCAAVTRGRARKGLAQSLGRRTRAPPQGGAGSEPETHKHTRTHTHIHTHQGGPESDTAPPPQGAADERTRNTPLQEHSLHPPKGTEPETRTPPPKGAQAPEPEMRTHQGGAEPETAPPQGGADERTKKRANSVCASVQCHTCLRKFRAAPAQGSLTRNAHPPSRGRKLLNQKYTHTKEVPNQRPHPPKGARTNEPRNARTQPARPRNATPASRLPSRYRPRAGRDRPARRRLDQHIDVATRRRRGAAEREKASASNAGAGGVHLRRRCAARARTHTQRCYTVPRVRRTPPRKENPQTAKGPIMHPSRGAPPYLHVRHRTLKPRRVRSRTPLARRRPT